MASNYCPNCNCTSCEPVTDDLNEENKVLRAKILRLENHILGSDKVIAELKQHQLDGSMSKEVKQ